MKEFRFGDRVELNDGRVGVVTEKAPDGTAYTVYFSPKNYDIIPTSQIKTIL